ncbi:MAG: hypothetical protein ACTSU2_13080 [Promethearchaeota archaeon]
MENEIVPDNVNIKVKNKDVKSKESKKKHITINTLDGPRPDFHSTRHDIEEEEEDPWLENPPRLGRRESEPHSYEITRIYDILKTNFNDSRVTWDLYHYFNVDGDTLDIQFDVSFFIIRN